MEKRALISVSDKTHIEEFAKGLSEQGYTILSTGGTLKAIQTAGIEAISVEDVTGFPEIMDGRVKTLHPYIHGGLLAKRDNANHIAQINEHGIAPIDVVVVNLYPFQATLNNPEATADDIIENIDIGGPSMLRAAAKNFNDVTVVVDPTDYESVLADMEAGTMDTARRRHLAAKVFRHTAHYDALIADYFTEDAYPDVLTKTYEKVQSLRYGENPHQSAAFYQESVHTEGTLAQAKQLHGKALSYNNIQDANAAIEMIRDYQMPAAVAVKHMNPCGIGMGETVNEAFARAYDADPISIFGGIVVTNREIDASTAEKLHAIFLEIVIAPKFSDEALEILMQKKNIRLLELDVMAKALCQPKITSVRGGVLVQDVDEGQIETSDLTYPTKQKPSQDQIEDLLFAWKAVKHVKSNAIVLAGSGQTAGVGAGQMNRVGAAKIAIEQAGEKAKGAVMASDAFFPMPDTVEAAAKAGVTAIIQPGGSKRDQDSIDVCDQYGISMVFTSMRHFKH